MVYQPGLLAKGVWLYFYEIVGIWFPVVLCGLACFVIWQVLDGNRSWVVGAVGAFVALVVLIVGALLVVHLRRAGSNTRALGSSTVMLSVGADGLGFSSVLGNATIPWSRVEAIRSYRGLYLLRFQGGGYSAIPASGLGVEFVNEIRERISQSSRGVV